MNVELRPVPRLEWEQILRRARFAGLIGGTGRVGGKGLPTRGGTSPALFMAVALDLSSYGNFDGANIWPGDGTIAVDLECSVETVRTVRRKLLELGLLQRVGGRRGDRGGEEYRLTLPTDLLDRLEVLTPAAHKLAAKLEYEKARGKRKPAGGSSGPPEIRPSDVDSPSVGDPVDPPRETGTEGSGGSSGPTPEELGGSSGPHWGDPVDPSTYPETTPGKAPTHSDQDLIADVTGPRATAPSEDPNFAEVDPKARWVGTASIPAPPAAPRRCSHGFPSGRRTDGTFSCALCRRAAAVGSVTAMFPVITPDDDGPLARVIPLPRTGS